MVLGNKSVILLVKLPIAVPSLVYEPVVEGLFEVLQHIPLPVTADPPFEAIFPPDVAVVRVTEEAGIVVKDGKSAAVIKLNSFPYVVPVALVAYALTWYKVTGCNPVILLVKLPVPVPFEVKLSLIVGDGVIAQQIPRAVILGPPLSVMLPPETAVVEVIDETSVVVRVAIIIGFVVNESSLPYDVPKLLVA